jgi:outer membrane protein OmpA-like peptidoglycan-associated protein
VFVVVMAADKTDPQQPAVYVLIVESKAMEKGLVTVAATALDQSLISTGKAVIYGIYFDFDKADVKPESAPQLEQIASLLREHADLKLLITGHTDNQGSIEYNQKLSQRRADAIVAMLSGSYAVANNESDEGRAKNRRVELIKQ